MLAAAGGTPGAMLPAGVDDDDAIGFGSWRGIIGDVPPPPDGTVLFDGGAAGRAWLKENVRLVSARPLNQLPARR